MNEMPQGMGARGSLDARSQAELDLNNAWNKVDAVLRSHPDLYDLAHSQDESLTESAKHEALSAKVAESNDPELKEAWAEYVRATVKDLSVQDE